MIARRLNPTLFTALWLMPVLALLQASLMGHFAIDGVVPGLMLIAVVDWGILRGMDEAMLWGFLGGLSLDVFSGFPLGTSALALVAVASVVSLGEGTFMRTHALLPPATVFAATILYYLVVLFVLESTQHNVEWLTALRTIALPSALYNALVNIPGFWLAQRLEDRIYPTPRASW